MIRDVMFLTTFLSGLILLLGWYLGYKHLIDETSITIVVAVMLSLLIGWYIGYNEAKYLSKDEE